MDLVDDRRGEMVKIHFWQSLIRDVNEISVALIKNRQVIVNLVRRDITIRYKGSLLGLVWAFLNPLGTMLIFLVIFSFVAKFQTSEPYALFLLTAIIPWGFFANSVQKCVTIFTDHAPLIKKVYFPREILPLSTVLAEFIHLLLGLVLLLLLVIPLYPDGLSMLWLLPVVLLVQCLFTLGLCFFVSVAQVFLRDLAQLVTILLSFWYFLTPIFYPISIIPAKYHYFYLLNPQAALMIIYRAIFFGSDDYLLFAVLVSWLWALVIFLEGLHYFKMHENSFVKLL
ncbi:ABC transporter permease [bacterium]|nr:ABC transporter permease [bacterium]